MTGQTVELVESKRDIHNPEGIEKPDAKYQDDDYTQDRLDGLGHWHVVFNQVEH